MSWLVSWSTLFTATKILKLCISLWFLDWHYGGFYHYFMDFWLWLCCDFLYCELWQASLLSLIKSHSYPHNDFLILENTIWKLYLKLVNVNKFFFTGDFVVEVERQPGNVGRETGGWCTKPRLQPVTSQLHYICPVPLGYYDAQSRYFITPIKNRVNAVLP